MMLQRLIATLSILGELIVSRYITVLYTVDKGLRDRNVLHQLLYIDSAAYLLTISLPNVQGMLITILY